MWQQLTILLTSILTLTYGQDITPAIVLHGGAGTIDEDKFEGKFEGLKMAARVGHAILMDTDNPMEAAERAVNILENSPSFNAGYGSVQTDTGEVEMDAAIMNGTDLSTGAVGALRHVRNPISVARMVMERTQHVFLVAEGAEKFAQSQGVELVPTDQLIPNNTKIVNQSNPTSGKTNNPSKSGTVGAVAINSKGQIATATSTGGMSGKMEGRIGDTPIIGAGTLADDDICGISGTGVGEGFIRYRVATRIAYDIEHGVEPSVAILRVLNGMTSRIEDADGGAIVITKNGTIAYNWNSLQMAWAYARGDELHFGIEKGDDFIEPIVPTTTTPAPKKKSKTPKKTGKNAASSKYDYSFTIMSILTAFHLVSYVY